MKVNKADPQTLDILTNKKKQLQCFSILETTRFVNNNFIPVVSVLCKYPSWQNDAATHGNSWHLCRCSPDTLSEPAEIYYQIGPEKSLQKADKSMDARLWFNKELGKILPKRIFRTWPKHVVSIRTSIYNDIHHFCKALNEFDFWKNSPVFRQTPVIGTWQKQTI